MHNFVLNSYFTYEVARWSIKIDLDNIATVPLKSLYLAIIKFYFTNYFYLLSYL